MKYRFILDGSDVTSRVELGASVKERFAEELDVGGIALTYWDTGDAIKVLSRVDVLELTDDGQNVIKEYNMLVMRDYVEPITKGSPRKFRHQLDLIELTHKLDYYVVNALAFTQPTIELTTAPFESFNTITTGINENVIAPEDSPALIELPEIPDIFNRYVGEIKIPQVDQATVWKIRDDQETIVFESNEDMRLTVTKVEKSLLPNKEIDRELTFVSDHNISEGPLTLNLEPGEYVFRVYVPLKQVDFPSNEYVRINRRLEYQVEVANYNYTLLDVVNRIRDVSPIEKKTLHAQTRIFDIDENLENRLSQIEAPQLYLERLTTRESLNEALKYVNAISRLLSDETDLLSADFFNEKKNSYVLQLSNVYNSTATQDNLNYVSNNRSFIKNAINTNSLNNPSVNELGNIFKGVRSSKFQVLPETGQLNLQYNISRILSVTAKVNVKLRYNTMSSLSIDNVDGVDDKYIELDVDLTPYIVEENILNIQRKINDTFGSSGGLTKFNRAFFRDLSIEVATYKYGNNIIDLGGEVGGVYERTKFHRMIESAVTEKLSYMQGQRYKNSSGVTPTYPTLGHGLILNYSEFVPTFQIVGRDRLNTLNLSSNDYLFNIPINVTYIALEDAIIDSHKEDTTIIDKYSEGVNNINARIANFERASINNYGIAQRLGVPAVRYGKISKEADNENVGDVNQDNQVIVEKESIYYPDHKVLNYSASRDFNRLSQFVQVDRAYRPYENPLIRNVINRNDMYNEYIEYSTASDLITPETNDTFISDMALKTMLNTFIQDTNEPNDYVKMVILRTDGFLTQNPDSDLGNFYHRHGLIIPVIAQGGKNILSFKFGFKSNISAGDFIRENDDVDNIQDFFSLVKSELNNLFTNDYFDRPYGWWREFVTYGDRNGRFDELYFKMLTDYTLPPEYGTNGYFLETQFLPLITSSTDSPSSFFPDQSDTTAFETGNPVTFDDALIVKKDSGEIYSLTYQVAFTPKTDDDNDKIILGKKFGTQNLLVYPFNDKEMRLYLYNDLNDKYSKFDDAFIKPAVTDVLANVEIVDDINRPYGIKINNNLTNYTHWALGDTDGNLYLANNTNNPYVFFEPRNKRSTINYNW